MERDGRGNRKINGARVKDEIRHRFFENLDGPPTGAVPWRRADGGTDRLGERETDPNGREDLVSGQPYVGTLTLALDPSTHPNPGGKPWLRTFILGPLTK